MAETLQVPIDTMVLNGPNTMEICIVQLFVLKSMPDASFRKSAILLLKMGLLLPYKQCLDEHRVGCTTEGPYVVDVKELFYHKAFEIQMSYSCDDSSLFIVPYGFL